MSDLEIEGTGRNSHPLESKGRLGSWTGLNFKLSRVTVGLGKLFNLSGFSFVNFKMEEHLYFAGLLCGKANVCKTLRLFLWRRQEPPLA